VEGAGWNATLSRRDVQGVIATAAAKWGETAVMTFITNVG
jgi:hypothetical protein